MNKNFYVYILANARPTIYIGMTNDLLRRRIYEHQNELIDGFTKRYHIHTLVYFETPDNPTGAIIREKQLKNMGRKEKLELIQKMNPSMRDLSDEIM